MLLSVCSDNRDNPEPVFRCAEPDVKSGKMNAVDSFRVIGIARSRILFQQCDCGLPFGFRQQGEQRNGKIRAKPMQTCLRCIALCGIRSAVRDRNIRLDIIDRRPVQQINAGNEQLHGLLIRADLFQLYAGKPDRIRPERRTRSEYADAGIAAEPRRTHRRRPALSFRSDCGMKAPQQPDM